MAWPVIVPDGVRSSQGGLKAFQAWLVQKRFLSAAIDVEGMVDMFFLNELEKAGGGK
jgi:hypothetical protein